jgi:hypothetical protein
VWTPYASLPGGVAPARIYWCSRTRLHHWLALTRQRRVKRLTHTSCLHIGFHLVNVVVAQKIISVVAAVTQTGRQGMTAQFCDFCMASASPSNLELAKRVVAARRDTAKQSEQKLSAIRCLPVVYHHNQPPYARFSGPKPLGRSSASV